MNIEINLKNDKFHFEATNGQGIALQMDASPAIGGENKGFLPMETLLAGLGGCSAIDIISILKKQRQSVDDVNIKISATRRENEMPAIFETINVHFVVSGKVDEEILKKAIVLTTKKYCSVYHIMKETAAIIYSYEIQNIENPKTKNSAKGTFCPYLYDFLLYFR